MEFHLDMSNIIKDMCQTGAAGGSVSSRPSQAELSTSSSPKKSLSAAMDQQTSYSQVSGSFKRYSHCQVCLAAKFTLIG